MSRSFPFSLAPLAGAALLLAACAMPAEEAVEVEPPAPAVNLSARPGLPLALPRSGEAARTLVEQVAAGCWLDGVVRGGSMVVDRQTGRIIITSDTEDLLIADIVPEGDNSIVRLTGPAAADPTVAVRLSETLQTAVETGETRCRPSSAEPAARHLTGFRRG